MCNTGVKEMQLWKVKEWKEMSLKAKRCDEYNIIITCLLFWDKITVGSFILTRKTDVH